MNASLARLSEMAKERGLYIEEFARDSSVLAIEGIGVRLPKKVGGSYDEATLIVEFRKWKREGKRASWSIRLEGYRENPWASKWMEMPSRVRLTLDSAAGVIESMGEEVER